MTSDSIGQRLRQFIELNGTACEKGVSHDRVTDFERQHNIRMPDDMQSYFVEANGTGGDYAFGLLRLWGLDEIQTVSELMSAASKNMAVIQATYEEPVENGDFLFVFADFLHESQLYAIHLSSRDEPNRVMLLDGSEPTIVADSFLQFVELYLSTPERLRLEVD